MNKKILSVVMTSAVLLSGCITINKTEPVSNTKKQETAQSEQNTQNNKNTETNNSSNNTQSGETSGGNFVDVAKLDSLIRDIENLQRELDNDIFDDEREFERKYDFIDDRYEMIKDRYHIDDDKTNNNVKLPMNEFNKLQKIKFEFENLLKEYKQKYNIK